MKHTIGRLSIVAFVVLGLVAGAQTAFAATEQEVSGEVVRVLPDKKQVVLNVYDSQTAEEKPVTIRIDGATRLEGVQNLSELKEGQTVRVQTKKHWLLDQRIAQRLVYNPPPKAPMSSVQTSQLHQIEGEFAHGQMGDVEYETKRQVIQS